MKPTYLHPTQESGRRLFSQNRKGPVVMLNLLKFRETADYSGLENLAPANSISGREAFERYISRTRPFLEESGGKILFLGESNDFLIGPEDEAWDYVMLIQQNSLEDFLSFASNEEYLKGMGHRDAALIDSRLLPVWRHD